MKKLTYIFILLCVMLNAIQLPKMVKGQVEFSLNGNNAILIEARSGEILYQKNADQKLYPASMTKMMGMYLILEAIEQKKASFDDEVIASSYASSMGGTQIFLEPFEKMKLVDLFKAVAINSANDAIVALGEHVYGSNENFVKKMNEKAKSFGTTNTNFVNATGFDHVDHYSSPKDMALIAKNLLRFDEQILQFSKLPEAYIRQDSDNPFWLVNTNKLVKYYQGMDGLKTGFTSKAGYNLAATAKRQNLRLISVVMGEESIEKRSQDTIRLLDYGFGTLESKELFQKETPLTYVTFKNSLEEKVPLVTKEDVYVILNKDESLDDIEIIYQIDIIEAPVNPSESVGKLIIKTPSNKEYIYLLYPRSEVKKINFFDLLLYNLAQFFG